MKTFAGILLAAALLAGCSKKEEMTFDTPEGRVKVTSENNDGKMTIEGPDGKLQIDSNDKDRTMTATNEKGETMTFGSSDKVDLSAYGIEIYPGATAEDGKGGMSKIEGPDGTMVTVALVSKDSVQQVADFYKKQIKDAKSMGGEEGAFVTGKTKDGHDVTATAAQSDDKKETLISITITEKKKS